MKEHNETDHKNLIVFKTLTRFISELNQSYGETHHSLQLYNRLIEKTAVVHTDAIKRHINELQTFCSENRDAIVQQDTSLLTKENIQYSDKVYVNISDILQNADDDDITIIWKYITCIAIQFDSTIRSDRDAFKKALVVQTNKNVTDNSSTSENSSETTNEATSEVTSEANFLENMAKKVSENVDENDDPMKAVGNIISSGVFTEMITDMNNGLQSGDLNLAKLMGSVQTMASQVKPEENAGNGGGAPDLSKMMEQMTGMMGQLSKQM